MNLANINRKMEEEEPGKCPTDIFEAVNELLLKNGYFNTCDCLQKEIIKKGYDTSEYSNNSDPTYRFGQTLLLNVTNYLRINIIVF